LPAISFALNTLLNKSTNITPFKLKYTCKLKSALKAAINAIDFKPLIKKGVKAFVK